MFPDVDIGVVHSFFMLVSQGLSSGLGSALKWLGAFGASPLVLMLPPCLDKSNCSRSGFGDGGCSKQKVLVSGQNQGRHEKTQVLFTSLVGMSLHLQVTVQ